MSHAHNPLFFIADHVLLGGRILQALECGHMPMNAADYLELTTLTACDLGELGSDELKSLRVRMPAPLREMVDNVLHARGDAHWAGDPAATAEALRRWEALLARMRARQT